MNGALCGRLGYDGLALLTINVVDLLHPDDVNDTGPGLSEQTGLDRDAVQSDTQ
ncbi:hypothetical protein GTR02_20750 [Kineococcus sp. R8]|uniref:hypothetical protein n=1 Tax=Kineococcus siccus TaxID=2696567 RepID=UPI001411FF88|nr:hypothetical protein [Kineococcus siccus]NAZ84237.1 hypothetical protein [Kineococcus siccus]